MGEHCRVYCRLTRDALYNLHELALDGNFVHKITTFPDVEVFLYNPDTLSHFQEILRISHDLPTMQLSYDTTFNLGDFYISILLFRYTIFQESPVVPLAYMIHERKYTSTHTAFFQYLQSICPEIDSAQKVIMITDSETAIRQGILNAFPNLKVFLCWNHLFQNCKRWLRDHGVSTSMELTYYVDTLRSLFASQSKQTYTDSLLQKTTEWSQPFASYFVDTIHPVIDCIGTWELQAFGFDSATTNASEAFNCVLKKLQVKKTELYLYRSDRYSNLFKCTCA